MISKTKIGIILASAMVATTAVSAGIVLHRHHQVVVAAAAQATVQAAPVLPKPTAGTPTNTTVADPANDSVDSNMSSQQSAETSDDVNQTADAAQADVANADQSQADNAEVQQPVVTVVRRVSAARAVHVLRSAAAVAATPIVATRTVTIAEPAAPAVHESIAALVVPAGTPLTLRLDEPLGSKISQVDQSFSATLDQDVEVNGRRLIPSGAHFTGRVLSARPAGLIAGEATLRLAVTSVKVHNREIEVVTDERSFGPGSKSKNKVARFMKGIGKRLDGEEREVLLAEQTAYTFNLSHPLEIR